MKRRSSMDKTIKKILREEIADIGKLNTISSYFNDIYDAYKNDFEQYMSLLNDMLEGDLKNVSNIVLNLPDEVKQLSRGTISMSYDGNAPSYDRGYFSIVFKGSLSSNSIGRSEIDDILDKSIQNITDGIYAETYVKIGENNQLNVEVDIKSIAMSNRINDLDDFLIENSEGDSYMDIIISKIS